MEMVHCEMALLSPETSPPGRKYIGRGQLMRIQWGPRYWPSSASRSQPASSRSFTYAPTIDHAYDSVSYLRTEVPFGWLVHNMHYWGANIMVVLVALHMMRVYIWGAYKSQLTWLIGIGLLVTTMALTFTGAPMIWDMKGFWAGEVGTSITGTAPVFGGIMKTILRGGETMGQLTLTRFFAIHIVILVPALVFPDRSACSVIPHNRYRRVMEQGKEETDRSVLAGPGL